MISKEFEFKRFNGKVEEILSYPIQKGRTLLYGSSFFANWGYDKVAAEFSDTAGGVRVLNHAFGGATNDELLYWYNRLIVPFEPSAIILRSGINDIFCGKSAEETIFLFDRLVAWLFADFPDIKLIALPIFDFPGLNNERELSEKVKKHNDYLNDYAQKNSYVKLWDISPFFYKNPEATGSLQGFKDIFLEDKLHLNQRGYNEFAEFFKKSKPELLNTQVN